MTLAAISGKRVLVTGATGFIGSHLCRKLAEAGAEIHGVSRQRQDSSEAGLHWWQADVADLAAMRGVFLSVRPQYVFHLASEVTGSRSLDMVLTAFRSNLISTVNLLTLVAEHGCTRIVLTGSLEEPEDAEAIPCSPYAAAKWSSAGYARMFHALYKTPVVTARVFMTYGPGQSDLQKLVPYVTLSLLRGESPKLSSGSRPVDWIYVDDVAEGLLATACASGVEGSTVDLGSGELVTIRTVVEKLARLIGPPSQPLFGALPDRPMERVRTADVSATTRTIGWKPQTFLDEGLHQTIEGYRTASPDHALAQPRVAGSRSTG